MSIELSLEKAYAAVAIANEPELAGIPFLYASNTTEVELDKLPLPSITLTALAHQEMVPNSGVFEVGLEIEVRDAAVRKDGTAGKLDSIFTHAIRPLLYKPLPAMISGAGAADGLKCFGQPERSETHGIVFGEGMVTRSCSTLFICSATV